MSKKYFNKKYNTYTDYIDSEECDSWSDSITDAWLNGQDISGDEWWSDINKKYDKDDNK